MIDGIWRDRWFQLYGIYTDGEKVANDAADNAGRENERGAAIADAASFMGDVVTLMSDIMGGDQPAPTLDDTLADVLAWQRATFGAQDAASVFAKLRSEVAEVGDAAMAADRLAGDPRAVLTECADVLIMLAGFVAARGFTIADLRDEVGAKDKINHGRTWRQNADGTWSHVKGETK